MPTRNNVERNAWRNMIHRCHNEDHDDYKKYGARGITVCDSWRMKEGGFEAFFAHVGAKPSAEHSLDRLDNNRGYLPGNVAWRTKSEQQANRNPFGKSPTGPVTINGRTAPLSVWARESGVSSATIAKRIREGREGEELISTTRLPRRWQSRNGYSEKPNLYL